MDGKLRAYQRHRLRDLRDHGDGHRTLPQYEPPLHRGVTAATETGVDALKIELRRCQQLGEASTHDPACLRTWAENRQRFLKPSQVLQSQPAPQAPGPHGQPQNPPVPHNPAVIETAPETDTHTNEAR